MPIEQFFKKKARLQTLNGRKDFGEVKKLLKMLMMLISTSDEVICYIMCATSFRVEIFFQSPISDSHLQSFHGFQLPGNRNGQYTHKHSYITYILVISQATISIFCYYQTGDERR